MGVEPLYVIYSTGKPMGDLRRWTLETIVYQEMPLNHPAVSAFFKMQRLNRINPVNVS
jgi:hypothetical protein